MAMNLEKFIDNIERHKEVKIEKEIKSDNYKFEFFRVAIKGLQFQN